MWSLLDAVPRWVFSWRLGLWSFNRFLTNSSGDLAWHGSAGTQRLAAGVMAVAVGLAVGRFYRVVNGLVSGQRTDGATQWLI